MIVRLPGDQDEGRVSSAVGDDDGTLTDWAQSGIALRAVRAHEASKGMERGYTPDGVWWIIDDAPE